MIKKYFFKICLFFARLIPVKKIRRKIRENLKYYISLPSENELKSINIMKDIETIKFIIKNKCSISRYGDGEIYYMLFKDFKHHFQPYNKELVNKLQYVLNNPIENCLICLPPWIKYVNIESCWYRKCIVDCWHNLYKYINKNYVYGNSFLAVTDFFKKNNIETIKKIWDNEDIVIVTGKNSTFILVDELFNNIKSIDFVYTKAIDAFSEYNEIIDRISKNKNKLYLLSLGITATVLAYDLAKMGIRALDLGHFTNYYLESVGKLENIEKLRNENKFIDGQVDINELINKK